MRTPPPKKKKKTEMKLSSYFAFKIILFTSPSVTSFLRGAPPPKKNPGSAAKPANTEGFPALIFLFPRLNVSRMKARTLP